MENQGIQERIEALRQWPMDAIIIPEEMDAEYTEITSEGLLQDILEVVKEIRGKK